MIWLVLALISAVALIILGYPLLSKKLQGVSRAEGGLSVYKQQLEELAADVSRGVLSENDAEPVKVEIQRRMLSAAKQDENGSTQTTGRLPIVAIVVLIAVPLTAFALYSNLGSPDITSKPLASRNIAKEKSDLAGKDLGGLVEKLAARLQQSPDNLDGWILLARTLSRMGRYEEAANTYLQSTRLAGDDADIYVGAGENFYFLANGVISEASLSAFEKAFEIDPAHPGARYYLALQDAQTGNEDKALNRWISLYNDSDSNASFMKIVRGRIDEMAEKLGRDVSAELAAKPAVPQTTTSGPSEEDVKAAANMSATDRQDMIQNMVKRLAARMQETPEFDGLMRLGQVYGTLRQFENSADAYGRAAALQQGNPEPLSQQAFALIQSGDAGAPPPANAVALYRKVLTMDAASPEALWYIGISEARAGNRPEALKHWNKLQEMSPEGSQLRTNVAKAINSLSQMKQN